MSNLIAIQRNRKQSSVHKTTNERGIRQLLTCRWQSDLIFRCACLLDSAQRDLQFVDKEQTRRDDTPFFFSSEVCSAAVLFRDTLCWLWHSCSVSRSGSRALLPAHSLPPVDNPWQRHTSRVIVSTLAAPTESTSQTVIWLLDSNTVNTFSGFSYYEYVCIVITIALSLS